MRPAPTFRGGRHTARSLALQVLLDCRRHEAFVQEALDRRLAANHLPAADRRLATQLVYGVLRRRGTLRALLQPLLQRQPGQVEPWLWDALGLGAYQLALLSHVPVHAAVHETVELAVLFGRPAARGFLNGVLRKLSGLMTEEKVAGPGPDALPLEHGEYRRLAGPVLPDPASRPVEYLSAGFSLPDWLARRWLERYGEEECRRLGFWFAGPAPLTLRCNPLRIERGAFLEALAKAGLAAEAGDHPQAVRLREPVAIRDVPGYAEGWFVVQDESAMRVATALNPAPGSSVLDLCAAPGGKTTHLAELMGDRGHILACDTDGQRLQSVRTLAERLGLGCIETFALGRGAEESIPPGPFDAVLVDVPCSNTGVLGRRPEVRWRLKPDDLGELVQRQTRLLRLAAERVRPGGAVVYSTCSIEPEENRGVVDAVVQAVPGMRVEAEEWAVPGRPADGGYWAKLRREESGGSS
jgi:16S rRNA (cytosine967-C5)-methyltransferase